MDSISLPRATPESQGVSGAAIEALVASFGSEKLDTHSLMIVRHGHVIAERWWWPYSAERKHMLFSLSKSFTSSAAGFAVQEGLLTLDDKVVDFFPEKLPVAVSDHLAAMRVRDLLAMATGHTEPPEIWFDGDWVSSFFAQPVPLPPGTHFLYNTPATYVVAAILHKITGEDLVDFLRPRLFDPLGIDGETWERCPLGIRTGGFGLSVRTEDIAKFGLLYAQKGMWEGRRLLSEAWVNEATSKHVSNGDDPASDWAQGYGFQFWRCRHGLYRGDGAFGQYCIVFPEQDAVVAMTNGVSDMQAVLNLIWKHLLPAFDADGTAPAAQNLTLRGPEAAVEPKPLPCRAFSFERNELGLDRIEVESDGKTVVLRLTEGEAEHRIVAHFDEWIVEGSAAFKSALPTRYGPKDVTPYAAKAAWTKPNELTVHLAYVETPFAPWLVVGFEENRCTFELKGAVSLFDLGDGRPVLTGKR